MDAQKSDMFVMTHGKFFEGHHIPQIRERLLHADDNKWGLIQSVPFKDPTIIMIVSLLAGAFGVDRFLLGDIGLGVGKLLTCGGVGVWTVVDWFLIMAATREKNLAKLNQALF